MAEGRGECERGMGWEEDREYKGRREEVVEC